jgi:hypothetical protein
MQPHAGGHGAGMTNMIFAPRNATIIEFAMSPHVDRCYGYMAVALGMEYWLVPQVSAFYHLNYTMDSSKADAVVRLLQHVLQRRNLNQDSHGIQKLLSPLIQCFSRVKLLHVDAQKKDTASSQSTKSKSGMPGLAIPKPEKKKTKEKRNPYNLTVSVSLLTHLFLAIFE